MLRFLPRNDTEDACLHRQIKQRTSKNRDENRARDIFSRVAHSSTYRGHIVITEIRVNRLHRGVAQPREKNPREIPCAGRKRERAMSIKMRCSTPDEPRYRANNPDPDSHRDFPNGRDPPIQDKNNQPDNCASRRLLLNPIEWVE